MTASMRVRRVDTRVDQRLGPCISNRSIAHFHLDGVADLGERRTVITQPATVTVSSA